MPAYVIAEIDVHDPQQYKHYTDAVPATITNAGGRSLAIGGELAALEGDWHPKRVVMLEFDDLDAAKRWYESSEYQKVKQLRDGAAHVRLIAVQGV